LEAESEDGAVILRRICPKNLASSMDVKHSSNPLLKFV
jgi:hypothetical protein